MLFIFSSKQPFALFYFHTIIVIFLWWDLICLSKSSLMLHRAIHIVLIINILTKNYIEWNLKLVTPPVTSCVVKYSHLIVVQHTEFSDGWEATRVQPTTCLLFQIIGEETGESGFVNQFDIIVFN